ncbi:dihydroorotase [Zhaonella formicivorans]|uniref:dihydroorotase n=1 Tax=Zhaonella formicivorans TaxID=2528593 RepID=UPI001D103836|nr:dihydroorotase [Zhaonella formicivorans]
MKLLIKGGRVIDPANGIDGIRDVLIVDGLIVKVEENINEEADEQIEAEGKIVAPGFIDMHVHLREPGFEHKETIASGTRAAAAGGFTAVVCMPNTNPVADNKAVVSFIKQKAEQEGKVKVYPVGNVTKGAQGEELTEIGELKAAGVVALSDDGKPVHNGEIMRRALEYAQMFQLPIISHCEDLNLVASGYMHEGYISTVLGLRGIPAAAEEVMVARDIILAELTGSPVHIAHISTAGSVRLVREAKARGIKITAEATPHHFTLTDEAVIGYNTATKVNPPLRSSRHREAILEALADGTIEVIATDHAPHAREEKEVEYAYAPNGMVGLETAVPLMVTQLIHTGILDWSEAIAKLTINPAKILNLPLGTLSAGSPADVTIIDPEKEAVVDPARFQSMGKNTPFAGWELKGWPVYTIVNGRVVMADGKILE